MASKDESPAQKQAGLVKSYITKHKEHFTKYHGQLDQQMISALSGKKYTLGEMYKNGVLQKIQDKAIMDYLGLLGIKGDNAKLYMKDLVFSDQELADLIRGRESYFFDLDEAQQLREQMKNRVQSRFGRIIQTEASAIQDIGESKRFLDWFVKEAEAQDQFPDATKSVYTPEHVGDMASNVYRAYTRKLDQKSRYKGAK